MHSRFAPKAHRFDYRIFMFAVDLDELTTLGKGIPFLSVNRGNVYAFHEKDYLPTGEGMHNGQGAGAQTGASMLKERVAALLKGHGITMKGGRVTLLTLPRVFGYGFNPVSFYFCQDSEGRPLAAIAEVTNTFREMKPYLLGPESLSPSPGGSRFRLRVPKYFYVSPFSDVDVAFDFSLEVPGEELVIRIDDYAGEERTLASSLTGKRKALTRARLAWYTLKYPIVTLRTIFLIHLHALFLALKRVPWFAKAARARDQRELYRPHISIAPSSTPLN
jgi:hypothetical protein